ncbi:hypothetical protein [Streptomyces sp. NPDC003480]
MSSDTLAEPVAAAEEAALPRTVPMTLGFALNGTSIVNVSVIAVQDLLYSVQLLHHRTFRVMPLPRAATLRCVLVTSVLSVGRRHGEKHYARGAERTR